MTPGDAQARGDAQTPTPAERPESLRGQTLGTFGANIAAAVLSLANVLVVARTLGAAGRGEVAFLIAVSTLVTWVASIGIQQANANIGGKRSATVPRLATNSVLWALGLGVASTLVVTALVAIFPAAGGPVRPLLLTLTLVFVPCTLLKLFLQYLLQSHYHFKITNIAWVAGPTISVVINTTLAALGLLTVEASIGIWLAGQTFSAVLLSWYLARHFGFGRPDRALARESASFGLKTHIGELAALGNYRADQWFVGAIAGSRELGRYSIAVAWAELLFYIPGVIALLQRPDLVRADPSAAVRLAGQSIRRGLLLSIVGASVLIIAAPLLCVTVFGDDFHGSIDDLRVLALGGVGIATVVLLGNAMIAQRRPLLAAAADATALVVTLGLDILLIPSLGGLGAAIATTVAYGVGSLVLTIVFVRLLGGRARDLVPRFADVVWYSRQAGLLLALVPRRGVAP
jgi:O-antigen/teichoic acid export membrane protein